MFLLKFQGHFFFSSWCRKGRAEAWCLSQKAAWVQFPGAVVGTLNPPSALLQATLLLSFLWMPALLPVASRLLLLPRALLSMASGSPPSQPPPASGSGYVPGSVSAAFVTCPNEKVAKEIARWGPRPDDLEGVLWLGEGCYLQAVRTLISLHPQGSGKEAPGSLRQPHPADHIHVSCQLEREIYLEGLRAFSGRNLPFPRLCSLLSLTLQL